MLTSFLVHFAHAVNVCRKKMSQLTFKVIFFLTRASSTGHNCVTENCTLVDPRPLFESPETGCNMVWRRQIHHFLRTVSMTTVSVLRCDLHIKSVWLWSCSALGLVGMGILLRSLFHILPLGFHYLWAKGTQLKSKHWSAEGPQISHFL